MTSPTSDAGVTEELLAYGTGVKVERLDFCRQWERGVGR